MDRPRKPLRFHDLNLDVILSYKGSLYVREPKGSQKALLCANRFPNIYRCLVCEGELYKLKGTKYCPKCQEVPGGGDA